MSLLERHHLSKLVAPVHDHVNLAPLEKKMEFGGNHILMWWWSYGCTTSPIKI